MAYKTNVYKTCKFLFIQNLIQICVWFPLCEAIPLGRNLFVYFLRTSAIGANFANFGQILQFEFCKLAQTKIMYHSNPISKYLEIGGIKYNQIHHYLIDWFEKIQPFLNMLVIHFTPFGAH
jgi:hypothetical protein